MGFKNYSFIVVTLLFLILFSCQTHTPLNRFRINGQAQGTTYSITYFSENQKVNKRSIDSLLKNFDLVFSTYIDHSIISKINSNTTEKVTDHHFIDLFKLSKHLHQITNGYFDPTVGTIVNFYGFGSKKVDSLVKIDSLKKFVGFDNITQDQDGSIKKKYKQIYLDFNAIAQGYSVDLVTSFLCDKGISDAIVEIGGEIYAFGINQNKQMPWRVGIDHPLESTNNHRVLYQTLNLKNKALATSGNYRKIKKDTLTGENYVHTINPLTKSSKKSDILSAVVIASTCAQADAYATAFMAMGLDESIKLLEQLPSLKVILLYTDDNAQLKAFKKGM